MSIDNCELSIIYELNFGTDMNNWEKKKLGEVCIVERGSSPRPIEKYQTDSPDGVNWIKIGDTKGNSSVKF